MTSTRSSCRRSPSWCSLATRPWALTSTRCSARSTASSKPRTNLKKGRTSPHGEVSEGGEMEFITKLYVRANEFRKGQTMTEYALILSAVAIVVFVGYQTMGTDINTLLSSIDAQL